MSISLSEFADKLNEIMPAISKEFLKHQTEEFYKVKVTLPQLVILDLLEREGESKMTDLANFTNVTTAAMTGIIDRLVRDGYVERAHDTRDRRIVNIKLTSKGTKLIGQINLQRRHSIINIFGKISQQDRDDYLRILTRIWEYLKR